MAGIKVFPVLLVAFGVMCVAVSIPLHFGGVRGKEPRLNIIMGSKGPNDIEYMVADLVAEPKENQSQIQGIYSGHRPNANITYINAYENGVSQNPTYEIEGGLGFSSIIFQVYSARSLGFNVTIIVFGMPYDD